MLNRYFYCKLNYIDLYLQKLLQVDVYIGSAVDSGGVVMPGGALAIDASLVSATSGFIVEKGGILNINK